MQLKIRFPATFILGSSYLHTFHRDPMGNALGRASRSLVLKKRDVSDPTAATKLKAIHDQEAARSAALRTTGQEPSTLDEPLPGSSVLDKLVRAIEPHKLEMYSPKDIEKLSRRRAKEKHRDEDLVGRITTSSIREILETSRRNGGLSDAHLSRLAQQHGASESLLHQLMKQATLPAVERAPDGRLVAKPDPPRKD